MAKIGIYGGSFNPPHLGHILAAREFQRALGLDRMVFVPAATPPHKVLPPDSPDAQTRLELLKLAVRALDFAVVDELELHRAGASYTVDTLRQLRESYPGDELYLCMGTDMFRSFESWYQPKQICAMARIAMAHRQAPDSEELRALTEAFRKAHDAEPIVLRNDFLEVSSTQVRRLLVLGGAEDYLDPGVLEQIRARGLYGTARSRKNLDFETLKRESLLLHKDSRVRHVIGCIETARELALVHGADPDAAQRAGILHDVTKALDGRDQLRLCGKYGIIISDFDREHTKLLHAVTGAAAAERVFGESEAVCQAIRWHTSGKADMSTLEKIIYVADYMEPNRDFPGVEKLRKLAYTDLDEALLLGLTMTAEHLKRQGAVMGRHSLEAMAFLTQGKERMQTK